LGARFGAKTPASSVQTDMPLIKTEFVAKLKKLANNSILNKEFAKNVMRDIQSLMESAIERIKQPLPILDALSGKTEFVNNALKDGILAHQTFVSLSVIFAQHGHKKVPVNHATMDIL
jgi:hypothetical protein